MSYKFSAYDLINTAVEVENASAIFYRRLAGLTSHSEIKDLFLMLAEQEDSHRDYFTAIAKEYKNNLKIYENLTDLSGLMKIDRYKMEAIFNHEIAGNDLDLLSDALNLAIKGEEDAALIYSWLRNALDLSHQNLLNDIIAAEQSHRDLVISLKKRLFNK